ERARVAGIFEVAPSPALAGALETAGIEIEDGDLLIEREVLANGKSRAFVGNRPVTAGFLKELAPHLGDIHGQHEQQQLFSASVQREMLDGFAGAGELAQQVASTYARWRDAREQLEVLDRSAQEKLRLADLWLFQAKEIEAVAPLAGEDQELENERRVLRNVVRIEETAGAAYQALYDAPESVAPGLRTVIRKLDELVKIDPSIADVLGILQPASIAVDEAAHALRHYMARLEADPGRLEQVESRMAALEKLKRKYGATVEEVLAFLEDAQRQLAAVEHSSERRDALHQEVARLSAEYASASSKLSAMRKEAAKQLSKRVEQELASLAMEKSRVEIRVTPAAWSESGADAVEIFLSPNVGEEMKPLERIASGGELSRVALALKTCTAPSKPSNNAPRTLVFDEVDAGVGGSAAEMVGRRLKKLAGSAQVLCVTHLPQIAGFADHHYFVEKRTSKGRTTASIEELSAGERTREIGRMLSGEQVTPEALRHAEQLLKLSRL
ncbi:MAG TPA: DNA repair protein RecN, partial [Bryobacteraceae bacterium]|nr:DNA repair protein RecN [Bryobacteraceae bacterium]